MTDHHQVNVNLTVRREPRKRRRSRAWDIAVIILASGLIGVATGDSTTVFAVVAAVALTLYFFGDMWRRGRRQTSRS